HVAASRLVGDGALVEPARRVDGAVDERRLLRVALLEGGQAALPLQPLERLEQEVDAERRRRVEAALRLRERLEAPDLGHALADPFVQVLAHGSARASPRSGA